MIPIGERMRGELLEDRKRLCFREPDKICREPVKEMLRQPVRIAGINQERVNEMLVRFSLMSQERVSQCREHVKIILRRPVRFSPVGQECVSQCQRIVREMLRRRVVRSQRIVSLCPEGIIQRVRGIEINWNDCENLVFEQKKAALFIGNAAVFIIVFPEEVILCKLDFF